MDERAVPYPALIVTEDSTDAEFEMRLRDSSSLAFRVAYSVVRNREDAEDVAQDAFGRAYARFAQLRDKDRFRAWLVRTTWRLAIDRQRSDRRRVARDRAVGPDVRPTIEELAVSQERGALLWRAIDELAPKLRLVIVLAAVEGHDIAEVARLLRLAEGTVKSRLFLARKRLAEKLQCLANDSKRR